MKKHGIALVAVCVVAFSSLLCADDVITTPIRTFSQGTLSAAAYSPGGLIATCGEAGAFLLDPNTGDAVRALLGHTAGVSAVAFSPDGTKVLTGSYDSTAKLWDTATGSCIRTFTGHASRVNCAAFSPDGTKVLTGSHDETAKLWDTDTGSCTRTYKAHMQEVGSVAFSSDGAKLLTGGGIAILWQAPWTLRVGQPSGSGAADPGPGIHVCDVGDSLLGVGLACLWLAIPLLAVSHSHAIQPSVHISIGGCGRDQNTEGHIRLHRRCQPRLQG